MGKPDLKTYVFDNSEYVKLSSYKSEVAELKAKLKIAREALEFYKGPYQKYGFIVNGPNGEEYIRHSPKEGMSYFAKQALKEIGEE